MSRLNTRNAKPRNTAATPIKTSGESAVTHEGGQGWRRTPKGELFLAAITSLNEDLFYESANERLKRIQGLVAMDEVVGDPAWTQGLVTWLRHDVGLRSIPAIVAITAVKARLDAGLSGGNRQIIASAVGRLDEASDVLAGWMVLYGRRIPSCVRRGVADALRHRLNERSYLKWSGRMSNGAVSLRDVINLTHPKPSGPQQARLVKYVLDHAYRGDGADAELSTIRARRGFLAMSREEQVAALTGPGGADLVRDAALTHEVVAGAIGKIPAEAWAALVPTMGYTALRMNLRRIAESDPDQELLDAIRRRIGDVEEAQRSRTMPVAFYSAYKNAPLEFAAPLQRAANASLEEVPAFKGRTLVLLDRSGSMCAPLSERSSLTRQDAANMFAAAIALRGEDVRVVAFDGEFHDVRTNGRDLLRVVDQMPESGGMTDTVGAIEYAHRNGEVYDRIVMLTDEQYHWYGKSVDQVLDEYATGVPVFTWNLAGYAVAQGESGENRWTFGGLSDKGFKMIPLLERGFDQSWPWE